MIKLASDKGNVRVQTANLDWNAADFLSFKMKAKFLNYFFPFLREPKYTIDDSGNRIGSKCILADFFNGLYIQLILQLTRLLDVVISSGRKYIFSLIKIDCLRSPVCLSSARQDSRTPSCSRPRLSIRRWFWPTKYKRAIGIYYTFDQIELFLFLWT